MLFESMRVFKGERGRVILRLGLPRLSDEGAEEFNAFYRSLAEVYSEAALSLAAASERDFHMTVSFTSEEVRAKGKRRCKTKNSGRRQLLIRRRVCLKEGYDERIIETEDKYDLKLQVFLK